MLTSKEVEDIYGFKAHFKRIAHSVRLRAWSQSAEPPAKENEEGDGEEDDEEDGAVEEEEGKG